MTNSAKKLTDNATLPGFDPLAAFNPADLNNIAAGSDVVLVRALNDARRLLEAANAQIVADRDSRGEYAEIAGNAATALHFLVEALSSSITTAIDGPDLLNINRALSAAYVAGVGAAAAAIASGSAGQMFEKLIQLSGRRAQSEAGRQAINTSGRHDESRAKADELRRIWASGKFATRRECADQEYEALGISFDTARKALRNTPDPEPWPAKRTSQGRKPHKHENRGLESHIYHEP